jgi:hypothetical protein
MFDFGEVEPFVPFQQSAPYLAAVQACGARVRWVEAGDAGAWAVERGRLRLISRVSVAGMASRDRCTVLRRLARWPGVTLVTPEEPVAGVGLVPLVTSMHHAVWALGPDLRAGLARNWRGHLAQAERAGVRVERGEGRVLGTLIAAEGAQRAKRRYRALPEGFSRALPVDALRLWDWCQGGETQAAMAFVRHGASATYHLSWGSAVARAAGVHGLMLMRAAEALRDEGVRWLDLGSVDTERAPGLARFKLGTGAELRQLGSTCLVLP